MTTYIVSEDIEGLIFDFDGTIVDSMPVHFLSWKAAFGAFDARFTETFFYDHAGFSLIDVVKAYNREQGTSLSPEAVVAKKDAAHAAYLDRTRPIPVVVDLIERYHGRLPMAVATGNSRRLTEPLMEKLNLTRFFDGVVFGEDVENSKPHPDCFIEAARIIGVPPQRCEVFEDGDPGIEAARRAGMKVTDIRAWLQG